MPLTTAEIDRLITTETVTQQPCSACDSSDAKVYYRRNFDGTDLGYTYHCFSCGDTRTDEDNVEYLEETGEVIPTEVTSTKSSNHKIKAMSSAQPGTFQALTRWGIIKPTAERLGITADKNGVYFPYYDSETGEQVGYKVRHTPLDDKQTSWVGNNPKNFFNSNNVGWVGEGTNLVICEGEPDVATAYQMMSNSKYMFVSPSSGVQSMPNACSSNAVWLSQFEKVYFIVDNDEAGKTTADKMHSKFPDIIQIVLPKQYNDISDIQVANAAQAFKDAVYGAKSRVLDCFVTVDGMVESMLKGRGTPMETGLPKLDEALGGGLFPHELSILMADPGKGKSTSSRWFIHSVGASSTVKPVYMPFEESFRLAGEKLSRLYNNGEKIEQEPGTLKEYAAMMLDKVNIVDTARAPSFKDSTAFVRWVEAIITASGTNFLCIDHVTQVAQSIPGEERLNIQGIINGLVEVVKKHPVHICVVTHNKRDQVQHDDEGNEVENRPNIRDGYGSGSIERNGFVVLALWGRDDNTKVTILKNRNGDAVNVDIKIKYLSGGRFTDGTVKVNNGNGKHESSKTDIQRGTNGFPIRGGRMDSKPNTEAGEAENQGVQGNDEEGTNIHAGLHDTQRDVRGSEGVSKTPERNLHQAHLSRVRDGVYKESTYTVPELPRKTPAKQHNVRTIRNESGNNLGERFGNTEPLVGTETPIVERSTKGISGWTGKRFEGKKSSGTSIQDLFRTTKDKL